MSQTTYLFPREGKRREKLAFYKFSFADSPKLGEQIFTEPLIQVPHLIGMSIGTGFPLVGVCFQKSDMPFLVRAEDFEPFDMENIGEIAFNDSIDRP